MGVIRIKRDNFGLSSIYLFNSSIHIKNLAVFLSLLIISLPFIFAEEYSRQYDANGNLIYDSQTDIYREYNELNQLSRTRQNNISGTILQEYTWDPIKERIFIKDEFYSNGSLKSSTYYFDDDYIVLQNSSGTFNRTNIYQDGVLVGYEDFDGKKRYVLPDHKGSAHLVLNESGDVIEENLFSPFAEPLAGLKENKFSYEAKEFDNTVQDYDFHFRKFSVNGPPILNQPDTLIQNVYDPQLLNRYSFERNNPYKYIDPSGHDVADPYELPAIQASPQTSAGGIMGAGEDINTIWGNIQVGRESTRQDALNEYGKYYDVPDVLTKEGVRRGGPTYEEIQEWKQARSLRNKNWLDRSFSVEKSSVISTQKTSYYDNIIGNHGSSDLYKNVAALGGKVDVRQQGIKVGILAVYYRMVDGKQILRYQQFGDEQERKSWEKSHKDYTLLTTSSA